MSTPFVTFPGTSGNYIDTADVNLLDADTAHIHQSLGGWIIGGEIINLQQSTALTPKFGSFHGQAEVTGASPFIWYDDDFDPVSPSDVVAFGAWVATDGLAESVNINLRFFDAGGGTLASNFTDIAIPAGADVWQWVEATATAPASSAFVSPRWGLRAGGGTLNVGDLMYWDAACRVLGTDPAFVPSLRIVVDLDLRAKVAATDWTPSSIQGLMNRYQTATNNRVFRMALNTDSSIILYWSEDGIAVKSETSAAPSGLVDGEAHELRVTLDVSSGDVVYYLDSVQFSTDTAGATSVYAGSAPLDIGVDYNSSVGPFAGDYYYSEIRDGISGPVVARMDAADVASAV